MYQKQIITRKYTKVIKFHFPKDLSTTIYLQIITLCSRIARHIHETKHCLKIF